MSHVDLTKEAEAAATESEAVAAREMAEKAQVGKDGKSRS